ncbi:hypothetical protein SGLAD_v1c00260 [Spiroplasma gladiatoris]|uniref:Uncharacterized protein n=1 Tax=Spiroplasma gladiatoris TaxID=2143 RepID=A0A4P7AGI9_9MOLU|nr:hypothetical protein [Spiroplasma gladiatoris]QBQ07227.1 hypothetical protein SGLAD_v1c00260 [Spiroplasma gladiatoris]
MKKLLSLMSIMTIVGSVSTSALACTLETKKVVVTVDGLENKVEKPEELEITSYDNTLQANKVTTTASLLLEGITFTKDKYQNAQTLNKQKEFLGVQGQSLSLNKYLDDNAEAINKDETLKSFKEAYESSRNTNFTSIDFGRSEEAKTKNNKNSNFDVKTDSRIFVVKKNKEDKKVTSSEIVDNWDITEGLDNKTKLKNDAKTVIETGKSLDSFLEVLAQKDAETKIFESYDSTNDDDKEIINRATKLSKVAEDEKNTRSIKLLGEFDVPTKFDKNVVKPVDDKVLESAPTGDTFKLYASEDGKTIQANKSFVYTESKNFAKITLGFEDPGINENIVNYKIEYNNINKIAIQWGLKNVDLTTTNDGVEYSIVWYEPYKYSFKNTFADEKKYMYNILDENFVPEIKITKK